MLFKPAREWARAVLILLLATGAIELSGCPDRFKSDRAEKAVGRFYDRRLARRPVEDLLTAALARKQPGFLGPANPHPVAYRLTRLDRKGARYRAALVLTYTGRPASYFETEEVRVVRQGGRYLLAEVKRTRVTELFQRGHDLIFRAGGWDKATIGLADLPAQATPLGGEAPFGVGRERFGPAAHNPANTREIAFGVNGLHALLATAVVPTDGGAEPSIRPLDLYFEGEVTQVLWLPMGNLLAVEVMTPAAATAVYLYDVANRARAERLHPPWEKKWRPPASVKLKYFAGRARALILTVAAPDAKETVWAWRIGSGEVAPWRDV